MLGWKHRRGHVESCDPASRRHMDGERVSVMGRRMRLDGLVDGLSMIDDQRAPTSKPNSQQRHVHVFIQTCIHAHASASSHQPASSLPHLHQAFRRHPSLPDCLCPVCLPHHLPHLPHLPFSTRPLHPKDPPTKRTLGAESNDPHPHLPLNSVVSLISSTRLCAINPPPINPYPSHADWERATHPCPPARLLCPFPFSLPSLFSPRHLTHSGLPPD